MAPHSGTSLNNQSGPDPMAHAKKAFNVPGKPFGLFSALPYYIVFAIYLVGFIQLKYYENPYWMILLIYVGFPLLDCISHDWLNPDRDQHKALENDIRFKIPLFALVILDNCLFYYALYVISQFDFSWTFHPGALFLIGSMAGHHFLVAHEIFHKRDKFHKIVGTFSVMKSLYMHFYIEHNFGHHKNVGTPIDPATARYRESIFEFLPRTVIGSYISAWNIEKKRLTQIKGYKTHWLPQNKMIWFTLSNILLPSLVCYFLRLKGLIFYLIMVAISIMIFETVNYIEHYGLVRQKIGPNEYEKVNITHSWNAPHRFSNYLLFKLQRHSDHHENSYKPYQILLSKDESPMLPHGYLVCIIVAYFPQIWFRMIDRRLLAFKERRPLTKEEEQMDKHDSYLVFTTTGVVSIAVTILHYYFHYCKVNKFAGFLPKKLSIRMTGEKLYYES